MYVFSAYFVQTVDIQHLLILEEKGPNCHFRLKWSSKVYSQLVFSIIVPSVIVNYFFLVDSRPTDR